MRAETEIRKVKRNMLKGMGTGVFLSLALLVSGCSDNKQAELKPPLVKTQNAVFADSAEETFSGQIKGRREAALSFQVGGEIIQRLVDVGSVVRAGDTLMTLSPRDVSQKVTQAQAKINSTGAELELARVNLARYEELFAAAAVPQMVLDQYRTTYQSAEAAYEAALAEGQEAQNALGYTELKAPADGIITGISAESGQVVAAGYSVMTLMQTDEMEAEVYLPENMLMLAPVGTEARVDFWANHAQAFGRVREVSPMADAARTYRVRVSLGDVPAGIEAGMTADITFPKGRSSGADMLIPLSAIYQTGNEPRVWLVQDGTIHEKAITIVAYRENQVVVRGVDKNDHVVISGVHKLHEGQSVREEQKQEDTAKSKGASGAKAEGDAS